MTTPSTKELSVKRFEKNQISIFDDTLAIEEPLELRLEYGKKENRVVKNISVTMRTPGNDDGLAIGFLFTEGIIKTYSEIKNVSSINYDPNIICVELNENSTPEIQKLERNFYTTSSCGVCGKSSIDAVRVVSKNNNNNDCSKKVTVNTIYTLPKILRTQQSVFEKTGGIHASALFTIDGKFIALKEDVGRHNALDKLIGFCIQNKQTSFEDNILLLSGRASFELIQKAAMANIKIIAAVGAPSSLAVELATEFNMTLIGFLRDEKFNVYCGEDRVNNLL